MSVHFGCPASGIMDEDVMCTLQGRWLLQSKINVQLNPHLLTAAVQRLQDSKKRICDKRQAYLPGLRSKGEAEGRNPTWVIT